MPQADILGFHATLLLLPIIFFLGYYFFATVWVPRLLLTLKARSWLISTQATAWPVLLTGGEHWPEIFLMFIQFVGLVWVLSKVTLASSLAQGMPLATVRTPYQVDFAAVGGTQLENFFFLWGSQRQALFFVPAASHLTHTVYTVLSGFSFYTPGKQFPFLLTRLRCRLPAVVSELGDASLQHD